MQLVLATLTTILTITFLQIRKLRLQEIKLFVQGPRANQWLSRAMNPGLGLLALNP